MGSRYPSGFYDAKTLAAAEAAFHDVWEIVTSHDPFRDPSRDEEMKALIVKKLLDLISEGTTAHEELRAQILRSLPLTGLPAAD